VGIGSLDGTERQINRELEKTGPGNKRRTFGPNSLSFAVAPAASPLAPTVLLAPNLTMPAVALGTGEYKGDACVAAANSAIGLGCRNLDTAHEYGTQAQVGQAVRAALAKASPCHAGVTFVLARAQRHRWHREVGSQQHGWRQRRSPTSAASKGVTLEYGGLLQ
jgi:hypothetical protein